MEVVGITTSREARVTGIAAGGVGHPTISVHIPARMVEDFLAGPSPAGLLTVMAGLRIEGVGLVNRVKARLLATVLTGIAGLVAARWTEVDQLF